MRTELPRFPKNDFVCRITEYIFSLYVLSSGPVDRKSSYVDA